MVWALNHSFGGQVPDLSNGDSLFVNPEWTVDDAHPGGLMGAVCLQGQDGCWHGCQKRFTVSDVRDGSDE